ncbi:hypothetical protein [Candidatus Avelusimicrobium alvi]|uniref:hypothetical protein n=1 Tax=Candidatus Avelusimicrobium alvi TaxID=3416221 RepID=UPI003D13C546
MSAVRTEQEKRCVLDKNYLTDFKAIEDIAASKNSKNYAYSLTSTGMEAQSKGKYGYTLKMPSYADGLLSVNSYGRRSMSVVLPVGRKSISERYADEL